MKKIIIILMFALLLHMAFAGNEFGRIKSGGKLLITDVDIKVDSLTSRNLEFGDTISKIAKPNSKLDFQIEIKNNDSISDMSDLEVIVSINELDLEKSATLSSLGTNNDKLVSITLDIPSDADEKQYDVLIEAEGELNNTIHRIEFEMDLDVEITEEDKETSSPTITTRIDDLGESVKNLSKEVGSYFNPYAECVSQRDSMKEKIVGLETQIQTLSGIQSNYDSCNNNLNNCNTLKSEYRLANQTCYEVVVTGKEAQREKANSYWILGFIVAIALILIYFNKEKMKFWQKGEVEKNAEEP